MSCRSAQTLPCDGRKGSRTNRSAHRLPPGPVSAFRGPPNHESLRFDGILRRNHPSSASVSIRVSVPVRSAVSRPAHHDAMARLHSTSRDRPATAPPPRPWRMPAAQPRRTSDDTALVDQQLAHESRTASEARGTSGAMSAVTDSPKVADTQHPRHAETAGSPATPATREPRSAEGVIEFVRPESFDLPKEALRRLLDLIVKQADLHNERPAS